MLCLLYVCYVYTCVCVHVCYVYTFRTYVLCVLIVLFVTCVYNYILQFHHVKETEDLLEFVDQSQLLPELGGYLEYEHEAWIKFRMVREIENFLFFLKN